ncbi:unnamed protein product [Cladocopium goreaui]|uniref:Uncharacterized protein n=1 Tax=Cladocopium goreaui TaxID=2562237 RepID=A0A9P1BX08_9DINO|nr:unnamed protein product [Cladocopium goreaui]
MAADTTEQSVKLSGDGNEQKVPEANDKEPSNVSHSDSNELSQWVLGALLRGEAPEQVAKFVATRVHLEDHDYEALQLHLQQHVHAVRALPEKDDGEPGEPIVGEFGKPPPLPKEVDGNYGNDFLPMFGTQIEDTFRTLQITSQHSNIGPVAVPSWPKRQMPLQRLRRNLSEHGS